MDEGLDLNRRRNTLQLLFGVVCGGCGSVVGYILPDEGQFIGAACGAVLGFIVGVFLCGLIFLLAHYYNEIRVIKRGNKTGTGLFETPQIDNNRLSF